MDPLAPAPSPLDTIDPRVRAILAQVQQSQVAAPGSLPTPDPSPVQPIATPAQGAIASAPTPTDDPSITSPLSPHQVKPGPIKSLLSNLLYGAGQSLVHRVGLPTDLEKQTLAQNQARAQQGADDTSAYRQAQTGGLQAKADALDAQNQPYTFGTDASVPAQLRGKTFPGVVAQAFIKTGIVGDNAARVAGIKADSAETIQADKGQSALDVTAAKYGAQGALSHGFKDVGGRAIMYDKRTGDTIKDMGPSNALITGASTAVARARAQAQYGLTSSIDENGNPTSVSRLSAIETGAPSVQFNAAKGILSDKVGIHQYADILDNKISPNLKELNDPKQRLIIAHTLAEADKNPGMLQAIITSNMQEGMTPQAAELAAGIMQGREFGSVARKYGGNMNGTEGLMNRIIANQASPLNSEQLNRDLIANDRAFAAKAGTALAGLTSHARFPAVPGGGVAPAASSPTSTETRTYQGHTYSKGADNQWHLQP